MKTAFVGYGIFREGTLCEYFKELNEAKRRKRIYVQCYKDKLTKIYPIGILRGDDEAK